ncbi:MAG TPA: kynureninase [Bacteroidetes bacterium]|nr:kynureninase [Bacteroidota bacterium]
MKNLQEYREQAVKADREDALREFRSYFKTQESLIYFDGNSLGMLPLASEEAARQLISRAWGERLIRGWNEGWWDMPLRVSGKLAQLTGCTRDEIIACDSTSVNLYKLVSAAVKMQKGRKKIVSDNLNFPSDLYIIQGVMESINDGHILEMVRSANGIDIDYGRLYDSIDDNTAVTVLSYVSFRSAFMYDMKKVTDYVHKKGALIIWDISHATGAVKIDLNSAGADMAVGCTYKYLNGGPGSPAFMYVNRKLQDKVVSPIWAWLGEKDPFEFSLDYRPSEGVRRYMTGSPNILSLCTLEPSLDIILEAGIDNLRKKSLKLTRFMLELYHAYLEPLGFGLGSPEKDDERGSHISLKHKEGYRICKALIDDSRGKYVIIPDFRPPDNIRMGLAPLYNRFEEVLEVILEIENIVKNRIYELYDTDTGSVT